uniref:Uncharacterized protein n=1 Tax=viral metagenome TaxID=1070528 RepID=A0A6C0KTK0_9ZZZZ
MTVQDSEKNLQTAEQLGVITTTNSDTTSKLLDNNTVIYSTQKTSNILYNGTNSTQKFLLEISSIVSPGGMVSIELNSPKLSSPLFVYGNTIDKTQTENKVSFRNLRATLIPGASLSFTVKNDAQSAVDNLVVKPKEIKSKKVCEDCHYLFGVPEKYTKAFVILMLMTILTILIFEFLTFKKEEKV